MHGMEIQQTLVILAVVDFFVEQLSEIIKFSTTCMGLLWPSVRNTMAFSASLVANAGGWSFAVADSLAIGNKCSGKT